MTEEERMLRWLLAENLGDDRLALEHAVRSLRFMGAEIDHLKAQISFGYVRGRPARPLAIEPKQRPEPVLIEGEQ